MSVVLWRDLRTVWRVVLLIALAGYGWRLADISWEYVHGYRKVVRNFYSQLRIDDSVDDVLGPKRKMVHGRINHGEQFMDPTLRREPTAYYCEKSGIGRAIRSLQKETPLHIGVVGLGAGTLAAYGRAGDHMRIYEINEQVLELARSDFTFLSDSASRIEPVLGDGRLMLEVEEHRVGPGLGRVVEAVGERRGVASPRLPRRPELDHAVGRERARLLVTARAGLGLVAREPHVIEEVPPQLGEFDGERHRDRPQARK